MTLVPLGVTSVVSICSNAISGYNFFVAWSMISQMHRRDIELIHQRCNRRVRIEEAVDTRLYKECGVSTAEKTSPLSSITDCSSSLSTSLELPTSTTTKTSSSATASASVATACSICLNEYQSTDQVAISRKDGCDHMFHKDCLEIWLLKHSSCPYCRMELLPALVSPSASPSRTPSPTLRFPFVDW